MAECGLKDRAFTAKKPASFLGAHPVKVVQYEYNRTLVYSLLSNKISITGCGVHLILIPNL